MTTLFLMAAVGLRSSKTRTLLLILGVQMDTSSAFLSPDTSSYPAIQSSHYLIGQHGHLRRSTATCAVDDSAKDISAEAKEGLGFTALPPIGGSSFWDQPQDEKNSHASSTNSPSPADPNSNLKKNNIIISKDANFVSAKFQIQYTCKKCTTHNSHSVTRIAYRKGIVIAQCKGCFSRHLLADNLGWNYGDFDFDNGEKDIEAYMKNRDSEARESGMVREEDKDLVMRVTQDVFDLESVLYKGKGEEKSITRVKGDQVEDGNESWS